jgi:hypothetical protein
LPQKIVRDRELKNYLEKAQKEAIKAQKKQDESLPKENDDNNTEFEKTLIDEKLREAEKYY